MFSRTWAILITVGAAALAAFPLAGLFDEARVAQGGEVSTAPAEAAGPAGLRLVLIPSGRFTMGAPETDDLAFERERPRHEVEITRPFHLAVTETTVGQFRAFVEATGYVTEAERDPRGGWGFDFESGRVGPEPGRSWRDPGFEQTEDHPVVQVSWIDAEAFCAWLGTRDGGVWRLPTEAEWEYACRAGTTTRYAFGDDPRGLLGRANFADAALRRRFPAATWSGTAEDGHAFTAPVGLYPANPWGLFDMHGNVWEWVADWHDDGYYASSPSRDPRGPDAGPIRAIRGGGWYDAPRKHRSSMRAWFKPVFRYCQLSGFRVVREVR